MRLDHRTMELLVAHTTLPRLRCRPRLAVALAGLAGTPTLRSTAASLPAPADLLTLVRPRRVLRAVLPTAAGFAAIALQCVTAVSTAAVPRVLCVWADAAAMLAVACISDRSST